MKRHSPPPTRYPGVPATPGKPAAPGPIQAKAAPTVTRLTAPPPPAPKKPAATAAAPARLTAPPPPPPGGKHVAQAYKVLPPEKLWRTAPWFKPWFASYPYAVVGDSNLSAQDHRDGVNTEDGYLADGNTARANIVQRPALRSSLRVSDDYNMAIEDTDLRGRQPKSFFATDKVINASNRALQNVRSPIQLVKSGGAITIVGWWGGRWRLHEVRPSFTNNHGGQNIDPDNLPQNCNDMASTVSRVFLGLSPQAQSANVLKEIRGKRPNQDITEDDLQAYAGLMQSDGIRRRGANKFAAPRIGEAYMIASITNAEDLATQALAENDMDRVDQIGNRTRWRDYGSGQDRDMRWPYHFAGVIAVSGNDRMTLENYARGDNRQAQPDPRWFFQMYGNKPGQSFHEATQGQDYVNPLTVVIRG